MAIIRNKDLINMGKEDIKTKLVYLRKELMKLRSQVARKTPPENPGKIRAIRRTIAKLLMFVNKPSGGAVKNK